MATLSVNCLCLNSVRKVEANCVKSRETEKHETANSYTGVSEMHVLKLTIYF